MDRTILAEWLTRFAGTEGLARAIEAVLRDGSREPSIVAEVRSNGIGAVLPLVTAAGLTEDDRTDVVTEIVGEIGQDVGDPVMSILVHILAPPSPLENWVGDSYEGLGAEGGGQRLSALAAAAATERTMEVALRCLREFVDTVPLPLALLDIAGAVALRWQERPVASLSVREAADALELTVESLRRIPRSESMEHS